MAKDYSQEYGIYYDETFAPIVRIIYVRTIIVIATAKG
jgi:hypothetical protein